MFAKSSYYLLQTWANLYCWAFWPPRDERIFAGLTVERGGAASKPRLPRHKALLSGIARPSSLRQTGSQTLGAWHWEHTERRTKYHQQWLLSLSLSIGEWSGVISQHCNILSLLSEHRPVLDTRIIITLPPSQPNCIREKICQLILAVMRRVSSQWP